MRTLPLAGMTTVPPRAMRIQFGGIANSNKYGSGILQSIVDFYHRMGLRFKGFTRLAEIKVGAHRAFVAAAYNGVLTASIARHVAMDGSVGRGGRVNDRGSFWGSRCRAQRSSCRGSRCRGWGSR